MGPKVIDDDLDSFMEEGLVSDDLRDAFRETEKEILAEAMGREHEESDGDRGLEEMEDWDGRTRGDSDWMRQKNDGLMGRTDQEISESEAELQDEVDRLTNELSEHRNFIDQELAKPLQRERDVHEEAVRDSCRDGACRIRQVNHVCAQLWTRHRA